MSNDWSSTTKRLVIIGLIIVLLLGLYLFRAIVPPVAIALILAYLLKPVADWIDRRTKLPRTLAVILVFLILLVILAMIPVTVVPFMVNTATRLSGDLEQLASDLVFFLSQPVTLWVYTLNPQDLLGNVQESLQSLLQPFATQTFSILLDVASSVIGIGLALLIAFYLIKDADQFRAFLDRISPPGYTEELRHLREDISQVWSAFFRGQVVLGIIIGLVVWIAMSAVGLPNAGLMGLLAGVLEVVPTFGPVIATIPAVLIALFRGSTYLPMSNFWFAVLVLGIYILIQQIEGAYLVPRIMGRRMQLHPVVVLIGMIAGGMLGGVLGIFLAAPVLGTARILLSYVYAKLQDQDPFPPEEEEVGEVYPGEIDAILFDLDGTLIETDDEAVQILARRLRRLDWLLPGKDPERAARGILMAFERPATAALALLDRLGLDDDLFSMADRLRRLRGVQTTYRFHPVESTSRMLRELSSRYYLGIVTTRSHREAQRYLAQQELTDLVQVVTGRDDTWRIKPHPSPVRHTAEQLGVPVERCLLVGDTPVDIQAARAAGTHSVGVLCGFGRREDLERAGANMILETTSDLSRWL